MMNCKIKSIILIIGFWGFLSSCETRTVKYSALNDLAVGAQQVVLYENGEFYLELGAGGIEGTYSIRQDTVIFNYFDKPKNWPDKLLVNEEYFLTIPSTEHKRSIQIKRK
jgi:hypothetical protein